MGGYCGVMCLLKAVEGCRCGGWRPSGHHWAGEAVVSQERQPLGREGCCRAGEEAAGPPSGRRGIVGEWASWRQPEQVAAGEWALLEASWRL